MDSQQEENSEPSGKWRWLKKFGIGTIIFFVVKGTISTILIIYTGKGIWVWLSSLFK